MTADTPRPRRPNRFDAFPSGESRFVSASFSDLDDALEATRDLDSRGFPRQRVSVFMATDTRERYIEKHTRHDELEDSAVVVEDVALEKHSKTAEGAGVGGAVGSALGAAGAAIVATGTTLLVPPLGVAIAGPLAAMFAGLGAGAATGGIVGALIGSGMTEYRASRFAELIDDGRVIVGVFAETEPERSTIIDVLREQGGALVGSRGD